MFSPEAVVFLLEKVNLVNEGGKIDFIVLLIALLLVTPEFVGFLCMIALEQCFSV